MGFRFNFSIQVRIIDISPIRTYVRKHMCLFYMPEYNLLGVTTEYLRALATRSRLLSSEREKSKVLSFTSQVARFGCTAVWLRVRDQHQHLFSTRMDVPVCHQQKHLIRVHHHSQLNVIFVSPQLQWSYIVPCSVPIYCVSGIRLYLNMCVIKSFPHRVGYFWRQRRRQLFF